MTFHPAVVISDLDKAGKDGNPSGDGSCDTDPRLQVIVMPGSNILGRWAKAVSIDALDDLLSTISDPDLAESVRMAFESSKLPAERASVKASEAVPSQHAEKDLLLRLEQMQEISKQILKEQDEEKFRLANELHEEIGQSLVALKLGIALLKRELPVVHEQNINGFIGIVESIGTHVRRLSRDLAPYNQYSTLPGSIRQMLSDLERQGQIKITADLRALEIALGKTWNTDYFRIVQQLVSEAIAHGQATEIVLETRTESGQLILEICDNGIGIFNSAKLHGAGFGFYAIQRRIAALRGDYKTTEIKNEQGKFSGTQNEIRIPIEAIQNLSA